MGLFPVAKTTVHSGYKAVRGMATLAFAPFSRHANTAQFPRPLTAPAINPTKITRALSPASVLPLHKTGSKTTKPAVTQMTMERAETRFVPSFMNKPLTPHSTMATLAYTIQCITNSSNRKNHNGRQRENHAAHLHFVQPLPQYDEGQHNREYREQPCHRSDDRSILLSQGRVIAKSA